MADVRELTAQELSAVAGGMLVLTSIPRVTSDSGLSGKVDVIKAMGNTKWPINPPKTY
jgi:hypothetical protein